MDMTKLLTYLLPILTVLLLLVYFVGLPNLNRCELPRVDARRRRGRIDRSRRLGTGDLLPILLITGLYALTAFFRLGVNTAPQTFAEMTGRTVEFSLPEGASPARMLLYAGGGYGGYDVEFSEDGEHFATVSSFRHDHVSALKWHELELRTGLTQPTRLRLTCTYGEPWLGEVVLLDGDGQVLPLNGGIRALRDEPDTVPETISFQNSSYFDEIYHARTAWEQLNSLTPYENTHPPLGKSIIGLGVLLFGMTPFGWRFSGTLFGVLMLPLLYIFLKKLFGGRLIPAMGTLLFATDFMHYVQTRIATIDVYAVFFILLMYLFLYIWLTEDRLWALALCGVSFGLGAASKWTCLYAGAGLGILWLAHWIRLFLQRRKPSADASAPADANASPDGNASPDASLRASDRVTGAAIRSPESEDALPLPLRFVLNVAFCLLFFVAVPGLIYYLSYLPYGRAAGAALFTRDYWNLVIGNQVSMFTYHSKSVLGATHPYSSHWYQWLIDWRPILYVLEYPEPGMRTSIAAFLNPVLCWGGLMSLPVLAWTAIRRRDLRAAFILVGYLSQLLPWIPVARLTFAYHYFPSALFLVLALGYTMALLRENAKDWKRPVVILSGGSTLLFLLFFPVLNGMASRSDLASALLRWLPDWPL